MTTLRQLVGLFIQVLQTLEEFNKKKYKEKEKNKDRFLPLLYSLSLENFHFPFGDIIQIDMSNMDIRKTVLVTGFGPFGEHTVNASWVAAQELAKKTIPNVNIVIREIPVVYDTVKKQVPQLWEDIKPDLVIHVGVSKEAKDITLEQQAHNDGYKRLDVLDKCPSNNCCVDGGSDCLVSGVDMEKVCADVNQSGLKVTSVVSHDPGRYLCDFSYFVSLNINRSKSAFVHVPPLDNPYSGQELADGLEQVILSMLKQINETIVQS